MGRSVSYLQNAERVVYFQSNLEDEFDYEFLIDDIVQSIKYRYPQFNFTPNKWDGDETRIILQNDDNSLQIGYSEYCGLSSLSIRINPSYFDAFFNDEEVEQVENELKNWIEKNDDIFQDFNELTKIGTFSNGEAVFGKRN
jgi:hypothetical protein